MSSVPFQRHDWISYFPVESIVIVTEFSYIKVSGHIYKICAKGLILIRTCCFYSSTNFWSLKFEHWTLVCGRTSCSNWSASTISCHASSCREMVTSHATSVGHFSRYWWWLKDQNDELLQVVSYLKLNFFGKWLPHRDNNHTIALVSQAHCILFGGWWWAEESKPTDSMQACSRKR